MVDEDVDEAVALDAELILCIDECLFTAFFAAAEDARVARETVAIPDIGTEGEKASDDEDSVADRSRPAARRRTPSFMAVLAVGMIEDTAEPGDVLLLAGERLDDCVE